MCALWRSYAGRTAGLQEKTKCRRLAEHRRVWRCKRCDDPPERGRRGDRRRKRNETAAARSIERCLDAANGETRTRCTFHEENGF